MNIKLTVMLTLCLMLSKTCYAKIDNYVGIIGLGLHMAYNYKEVGGWEGRVSSQRQIKPSIRTVQTNYASKKCQPLAQTYLEDPRDIPLLLG